MRGKTCGRSKARKRDLWVDRGDAVGHLSDRGNEGRQAGGNVNRRLEQPGHRRCRARAGAARLRRGHLALDVSVQAAIVELIRRLQAERGLSLLFITHNLPLVRSIADDVVMHEGAICEQGTVSEVLQAPKDRYTAQLRADAPKMTVAVGDG